MSGERRHTRPVKRIVCIQLGGVFPDFQHRLVMPDYGMPIIGSVLAAAGYDVTVYLEHVQAPPWEAIAVPIAEMARKNAGTEKAKNSVVLGLLGPSSGGARVLGMARTVGRNACSRIADMRDHGHEAQPPGIERRAPQRAGLEDAVALERGIPARIQDLARADGGDGCVHRTPLG